MNPPGLPPPDLATLLGEANHHPWESVRAALLTLGNEPHPRVCWLVAHLAGTKREYWRLIAEAAGTPAPPEDADLTSLMAWEVGATHALAGPAPALGVTHPEVTLTVAERLRLNAGQIAALAAGPRPA